MNLDHSLHFPLKELAEYLLRNSHVHTLITRLLRSLPLHHGASDPEYCGECVDTMILPITTLNGDRLTDINRFSLVTDEIKDVIQDLFEIQSAVHGYLGSETQFELVRKMYA